MRLGQLPTSGLHASAGAQSGDKTALIDGFAAGLKCLQRDKDADFRSGATDWVLQGSRLDWGCQKMSPRLRGSSLWSGAAAAWRVWNSKENNDGGKGSQRRHFTRFFRSRADGTFKKV